jgi:hypothetical protein
MARKEMSVFLLPCYQKGEEKGAPHLSPELFSKP